MDLETLVVSFGADLSALTRGVSGAKLLLAGFGLAAIGVGAASVKMAGDFQASMVSLVTGAGESRKNLGMVSDGILKMATQTGTSTKQLADGMYMVESAGFHGAAGLQVLKASAEGAKVGSADLGTVANAVTSALNAYGLQGSQATMVTNTLISTVGAGKMKMQDLAYALAGVLAPAKASGVSLQEVGAALSTMTMQGTPAADAATYLKQMFIALDAPAKAAVKTFTEIGLSSTQVSQLMRKQPDGMIAALEEINTALAKKFPASASYMREEMDKVKNHQETLDQALANLSNNTSPAYVGALKNIAGGSKNMMAMLELTGGSLQTLRGNFNQITQAVQAGGSSIQGWSDVQGTFNFKVDQAKASVETLMIKVGTALLPVLGKLFDQIGPLISKFGDWITKSGILQTISNALGTAISALPGFINSVVSAIQSVNTFYQQNHDIINTVAITLGLLYVPALIKSGVEAVIAGSKTAANFVVQIVKAGLVGWEAAGKIALWIVQVIASGTQAVLAGAKITASFIASVAKAAAQAVASGAVIAAQFIAKLVMAGAQAVITGAQFLASLVPAIISVATEAVVAAATAIPGLVAGFIAWATTAGAAAIATLAATWPILAVIAAIALVIAIIVLLVTHWKQVSDFTLMIWGHIRQFFEDDVVKPIGSLFDQLGTKVHGILQGIGNFFSGLGTTVHNVISGIGDAFSGLGKLVKGIWDGIVGAIKGAINWVIGLINNVIGAIDNIHVTTPFGTIGFSIPKIPLLEKGGFVPPGKAAIAGETGQPELVLGGSSGASVLGVSQTAALMGAGGSKQPIHVYFVVNGQTVASAILPDVANGIINGTRSGHPLGAIA